MKTTYTKLLFLALGLMMGHAVWGQSNPSPQSLPYSQNFGATTFTSMPVGMASWNGLNGGSINTQSLAEASSPNGNATLSAATTPQTTGGSYGYATSSNARPYIQTSSNSTNGVNQIALAITTSGLQNIIISYDVEIISAQPRTVGIVMQYRIGNSGGWTTVSGSGNPYSQAGGTVGIKASPNLELPSNANDQSLVQIRWAIWRGSETGNSSGIGIDNLYVSGTVIPNGDPTITHTGTTPAASNVAQGTTNKILYQTQVTVADGPATLTELIATTGGTWVNGDLDNIKLWFSTDGSFGGDVLLATSSSPSPGDITFAVSNQAFPVGTRHLFITCDVAANATIGNTISAGPDANGDFTYTENETYSGSSFDSPNAMTIIGAPEIQLEHPISTNKACGSTLDFGNIVVNASSPATVRIRNTGTADLVLSPLPALTGSGMYTITTNASSPINPAAFSDVVLQFLPTSTGTKTGTLTILNNDADEGTCTVLLTGVGVLANDNCGGAISLTIDPDETCNSPVNGTSVGATQTIAAITCGGFTGTADDDVWYKFEATETTHIITVDGDAGFDAVIDFRSGGCNGVNVSCSDATGNDGIEQLTVSGLTVNETYLIRVYHWGSGGGTFTICATTPEPPLYYRTKQSGLWSNVSTWESSPDNMTWGDAGSPPTNEELSIDIRSPHNIEIGASVTLDQTTIISGATLEITGGTVTVNNGTGNDLIVQGILKNSTSNALTLSSGAVAVVDGGGIYQHNPTSGAGSLTSMTWNSGSTCEILKITGSTGPSGLNQSYHHFVWNASNQTNTVNLTGDLKTILGNFTLLGTNSQILRLTAGSSNTLNVSGNLTISPGTELELGNGGATSIINIDGNLNIVNGTLDLMGGSSASGSVNVKGNLVMTSGTITESTSGSACEIQFNGTSAQQATIATIQNQVNVKVNNSAGVTLLADLNMPSSGILNLSNGILHTGAFQVVVNNNASGGMSQGTASAYINGNLRRYVSANTYTGIPIGNSSTFAPVTLVISSTGAAFLDMLYDPDGHVATLGDKTCPSGPNAGEYTYDSFCGSWVITPNTTGSESYSITLLDAQACGDANFTIAKDGAYDDCPSGFTKSYTSWSRFDILGGPAGAPLPVELTHFDANLVDKKVNLTWATAAEINNDYFLVQHSSNGVRFDDLTTVYGAGTSTQSQAYEWMHDDPVSGVNYYRLKQVDFDGQYEYSPVRAVRMDGEVTKGSWTIRPTVTSDMIYLMHTGPDAGAADWTVLTPEGRTVLRGAIQENAEQTPISVSTLTGGMYILRISSRDGVWSGRFQKD